MAAPTASELYNGPGANYGLQFNAQGQVVQGTPYQQVDMSLPTRSDWIKRLVSRATVLGTPPDEIIAWATQQADRPENQRKFRSDDSTPQGYIPLGAQGSQVGQQAAQQALDLLRPYATSANGLTSSDNAAMGAANNSAALQSQAMIQSLAQQAAMRGVGNAGLTQTMQAQAAQQGANNAAQMGSNILGMAQNRKMQAIGALGQAGMGLDTQAMQRGSLVDQFNQNATNSQGNAMLQAYQGSVQDQQLQIQRMNQMFGMIQPMMGGMGGMGGMGAMGAMGGGGR